MLVDPGQLENALLNLCLNSRDAMPDGGRLAIETDRFVCDAAYQYLHPGSIAGIYVSVQVTDWGTGIAAEHLPLVFEPFFTTKGGGTGLGLAMVYGFVQQSRGHVTVESTPGNGTTVRMLLPPATPVPSVTQRNRESRHYFAIFAYIKNNAMIAAWCCGRRCRSERRSGGLR